jgi:hypothetical protein
LAAALRVFELSYRKPAETVELDLENVDPMHLAEMTSAERNVLLARVLDDFPHLAELVPLRLHAAEALPSSPMAARDWVGRIRVRERCSHPRRRGRRNPSAFERESTMERLERLSPAVFCCSSL